MNDEQLYLPGLQALVESAAGTPRQRRRIAAIDPGDFPIRLNRVLAAENLSFATYAIMLAAAGAATCTVAGLSLQVGYSYHATRNQIRRTPWWAAVEGGALSQVSLSPEGHAKLGRISVRLARHV
jgi:hypothetical protein